MKKSIYFLTVSVPFLFSSMYSQDIYVDPQNGKDVQEGSLEKPFKSLSNALSYVNSLTGTGAINIKLFPGVYVLNERHDINPVRIITDLPSIQ